MTLETLRRRWQVRQLNVAGQAAEVVRTSGGGRPVLWLPGAQGTGEMFFKQLLAWGDHRSMVAASYPALTDAAALSDFVVRMADALDIDGFDLVGSSLGGWIGQWVAARHGDRVGRLVIGNSFFDAAPAQSAEKLQALESRAADVIKSEILARLETLPESELKSVQLELIGRCQTADLVRARMLAVQRAVPAPELSVPDQRILIVESDNDPLISAPMRAALRAAYPKACVAIVPGGGHYPYITHSDLYNAAVGAFLELS